MNKPQLLKSVIQKLESELEILAKASREAHEASIHEESKAEDQYDTRGLEASYLADAQSQRTANLEKMVQSLRELQLPLHAAQVGVGSYVELLQDGKPFQVFLLPCGAGLSVENENKKVSVVTLASPFGEEIEGKKVGDVFEVANKASAREYEILNIE